MALSRSLIETLVGHYFEIASAAQAAADNLIEKKK
jgi:hypothetical protein